MLHDALVGGSIIITHSVFGDQFLFSDHSIFSANKLNSKIDTVLDCSIAHAFQVKSNGCEFDTELEKIAAGF